MPFVSKLDGRKLKNFLKVILGWVEPVLFAYMIFTLVHAFLFEITAVNMSSMENTLQSGQLLIVWKLDKYWSKSPKRGDIIAFVHQEGNRNGMAKLLNPFPDPHEVDYIKRVIALPGEKIDIKQGKVYINGRQLDEPYVKGKLTDNMGMSFPRTIPDRMLFVMGDNRAVSRDSREFGYVEIKKIKGRAVFSFWPLNRFGFID